MGSKSGWDYLNLYLFVMVVDRLTDKVRKASPSTMTFSDSIMICGESGEQVEESL